jgi:hypothetical protein
MRLLQVSQAPYFCALTIHWNSTGSVEKFGLLPSTTTSTEMGGTWNGTERIDAEKL